MMKAKSVMARTAQTLLALPSPEAIKDSKAGETLRRFLAQLRVLPQQKVILSDPYFFEIETSGIDISMSQWLAKMSEDDREKLLLLSIIARPFDAVDPVVNLLLFGNPDSSSLAEGSSGIPFGTDELSSRRRIMNDLELAELMHRIPRRAPIETLSSEFIGGQPGNYGCQYWQAAEWSDDWAAVYGVTDIGSAEGYPFPWLLGFCSREDLESNFIELLREGYRDYDSGFYCTYGTVEGSWKLASAALQVFEDDDCPNWQVIRQLQSLEPSTLEAVMVDEDVAEVLIRVRDILVSADNANLGDLSLSDLLDKAGGTPSLSAIEEKLGDWEKESGDNAQALTPSDP